MKEASRFIHDFPSCSQTYCTLSIYHSTANPQSITDALKIVPDRISVVGEKLYANKLAKNSGWYLSTENKVESKDLRAHIDYLLKLLIPITDVVNKLIDSEFKVAIWCYWESANGSGGPTIDHELIKMLSLLPVDLYFDVYFLGEGSAI